MAAVILGVVAPSAEWVASLEPPSMLPADQPYNIAEDFGHRAFPNLQSRTRTVLVFHRPSGLTASDATFLSEVGGRLRTAGRDQDFVWRVLSPMDEPFLRSRLLSDDGTTAMIVVGSDVNYVTHLNAVQVGEMDTIARQGLPEGLIFEVTGEGGLGRDLSAAASQAFHRTTWVTLTALLLILAVVYRAPLAAIVPLLAIALSVYCALAILNLAGYLGWPISDNERTFVVVLLFGCGVDYSLFWMWRYREGLTSADSIAPAFQSAMNGTGAAILTSAATTVFGFLMLMASDLLPSFNAGRALAVALGIAAAAAITLAPALARLMGRWLFWPRPPLPAQPASKETFWFRAAGVVARHPGPVLIAVLAAMAWPVWLGTHVEFRYDAFGIVPTDSSSARGRELADSHFSSGQLFSWNLYVESADLHESATAVAEVSQNLADLCAADPAVSDVWSIAAPMGTSAYSPSSEALANVMRAMAREYYISADPPAVRLEIMLDSPPLSNRAMQSCSRVLGTVRAWVQDRLPSGGNVYATGLTPYIRNIKSVSDADERRVTLLVVAVIGLIVLLWVRDLPVALCMIAATLLVYAATLGVTNWVFVHLFGLTGIDWKVRLIVFVVLVAVGQDYNIFVVSRVRQEREHAAPAEAVRMAVLHTGSVVSSCGLIMAATLGSLAVTGLPLYQELGFAFAFGILLDTFVVRPLLVPAFYLLIRGRGSPEPLSVKGESLPTQKPENVSG